MAELRFLPDIDALVAPLPDDPPGGDKGVFGTLKGPVEEQRQDIDPGMYAEDDPQRPKEFKPANWAAVLNLCLPALEEKAKDLRIARWVVDALPRKAEQDRGRGRWTPTSPPPDGFAALADGLTLLRQLTTDGWEYILPAFDPDEPDCRNGPYEWLGDADSGAYLPVFVRTLPVAVTADGPVTRRDWDTLSGDDREPLTKAAAAADPAQLEQVLADIDRCRDELAALSAALSERIADAAPGFGGLHKALDDCRVLTAGLLADRSNGAPPAADEPAGDADDTQPAAATTGGPGRPPATREGAYAALRDAAALLQKLEPHSPVPYLVKRAAELERKSFIEVMKALNADDAALTSLRRELGIADEAPPPADDY